MKELKVKYGTVEIVSTTTESNSVPIMYNGNILTALSENSIKTLNCNSKMMLSDIELSNVVTLKTNKKLMNGDIEITFGSGYNITSNLTNVTADSGNANKIYSRENWYTLAFTPNEGYIMPKTVTVTGASFIYDKWTGVIKLSNPISDVNITIVGEEGTHETWVFNSNPTISTTNTFNATFTSYNIEFSTININSKLAYDNFTVYRRITPRVTQWADIACRTIILYEQATGDLLTYLQANATKQE